MRRQLQCVALAGGDCVLATTSASLLRATASKLCPAAGLHKARSTLLPHTAPQWMSAFLAEEIATLQRHGVERFAFYSVPSM
jgi:hypothetical protein